MHPFISFVQEARWKPFIVRPIPSQLMKPLLVFVNPKSGGNQVRAVLSVLELSVQAQWTEANTSHRCNPDWSISRL